MRSHEGDAHEVVVSITPFNTPTKIDSRDKPATPAVASTPLQTPTKSLQELAEMLLSPENLATPATPTQTVLRLRDTPGYTRVCSSESPEVLTPRIPSPLPTPTPAAHSSAQSHTATSLLSDMTTSSATSKSSIAGSPPGLSMSPPGAPPPTPQAAPVPMVEKLN